MYIMTMNTTNNLTEYSPKLLQANTTALFITIPQTTINYSELHRELSNFKHTKYLITKLEQHEDKGRHIHILIMLTATIRISAIHNIIKSQKGEQVGMIDYEKPKHIGKAINYCKKDETSVEGHPYLEYGEMTQRAKSQVNEDKEALLEAIALAENGNTEEALEQIKHIDPMRYIQFKQQIKENLSTENKSIIKYELPSFNINDTKLNKKQQAVWDILQETPKARRIIWVSGQYGSGKSFLFNYINTNHKYRLYNAGSSASMDNVVYDYDEQGVIAWDLPRTFDFDTLGNSISAVIEKFSDFGQSISSKKYSGKTQFVRGHCIVFSNREPLETLKHRDIIHIDLSQEEQAEIVERPPEPLKAPDLYSINTTPFVSTPPTTPTEEPEYITEATGYHHISKVYKKTKSGQTSALAKYIVRLQRPNGNTVSKALNTLEQALDYMPDGYSIPKDMNIEKR